MAFERERERESHDCRYDIYDWYIWMYTNKLPYSDSQEVLYPNCTISINTLTRWWFQTFFIFNPIWGRFPFWLIFFRWVGSTANQISCMKTYSHQPFLFDSMLQIMCVFPSRLEPMTSPGVEVWCSKKHSRVILLVILFRGEVSNMYII